MNIENNCTKEDLLIGISNFEKKISSDKLNSLMNAYSGLSVIEYRSSVNRFNDLMYKCQDLKINIENKINNMIKMGVR